MDEYIIDVIIDGKPETLKTYTSSLTQALDVMVSLDTVVNIKKIIRTKDNKEWVFKTGKLENLRELRKLITNKTELDKLLVETELDNL